MNGIATYNRRYGVRKLSRSRILCVMLALLLLACLQANLAVAAVERIHPPIISVAEGGGASFTCYGEQTDSLFWFDGAGERIADGGSFDLYSDTLRDGDRTRKLQTLRIDPISRDHTGTYCCSTVSSAGADCSSGVRSNLTVLISSGPIMALPVQRFEANTDAFVRCSVEPGLPLPIIFWFFHKALSPLDFSQTTAEGMLKFEANFSGLLIRDFQPSDVSNYTCEYQEPSTGSSSAIIEVLLATVPYIDGPSEAQIGTAVQLTCHHEEANNVHWVTPHSEEVPGAILNIRNISLTNSGTYKCTVEHSNGQQSTVTHLLQIYVPPLPSEETLVPFIVEGATAVLRPTTTNAPFPQLSYVWTKDGAMITEGDKYTVLESGVLQIADFSFADEGQYLCIGSNGYSEARRSFHPKTTTSDPSAALAFLHLVFTISGLQSCDDYATGYSEQQLLKQKMTAIVQDTCSCAVEVVLLEVTCSNRKQGTMKWQVIGPSAGAVVEYVVSRNPDGPILASNLTVQPCQGACNPIQESGMISDTLITAIAVASIVAVVAVVAISIAIVLGCYCKKRRKKQYSPNAMSPHLVRNPMYPTVTLGDEEGGQAELEDPPVLPPQTTPLPAEATIPLVIVDTPGYSKLQHFPGNRHSPAFVQVQFVQVVEGARLADDASITEQSYISENEVPLDMTHEIEDATDNRRSSATAENALGGGSLGDEMSEQLTGSAPIPGNMTNYKVNSRPLRLQTRSHSSDSDGSASCISNSPMTEMHLSVPSRIRRTDVFLEEEEVFSGLSDVSKNEPKRQEKAPMPLPRRRKYSQGNALENEGADDEAPPLYENVVLAKP